MKKSFIVLFTFLGVFSAVAQVNFGLRFAPYGGYSRVMNDFKTLNVSSKGLGITFSFGPTVQFELGEHYAFETGIWYTSKRTGLNLDSPNIDTGSMNLNEKPVFGLQYLQLPVIMKFYTNKIANLVKIYAGVGGTIDFRVSDRVKKPNESDFDYDNISKLIDVGSYVSLGLEIEKGGHDIYAGFVYNRGLVNMVTKDLSITNTDTGSKFSLTKANLDIKNDLLGFEVGIMF